MSKIYSFPPIENTDARCLILGSMPGAASLRAGQYYAHPRNTFWPIMRQLLGVEADLADWPYAARVERLKEAGIALWDVLASCVRPGSLDSSIDAGSIQANDFAAFFAVHPQIERVYFNGGMAEQSFRRYVQPTLPAPVPAHVRLIRLPSTSPAHAALTFEAKWRAWEIVLCSAARQAG